MLALGFDQTDPGCFVGAAPPKLGKRDVSVPWNSDDMFARRVATTAWSAAAKGWC